MLSVTNGKVTSTQLLFATSLIAFVVCLLIAFQTTQIVRDRNVMQQAMMQQDKPIEDAQRVQTQVNALALGTLKLSEKGDKAAKAIIDNMAKMGIHVKPDAAAAASPAAMPHPAMSGKARPNKG